MSLTSSPSGGHGDNPRRIYPFVIIPLLAILLIAGGLAFYVKSQAAPASRLVSLTRSQLPAGAPTNTTWYFDGGSVGGGFQEYLTMQNPDPTVAANVLVTYFLEANPPTNPTHVRKVTHTIPAARRVTIDVDMDLGTTTNGPHIDAAALVQVTSGPGIIVERPWYFNNLGVNSGTDAFGVTSPQMAYYFAEADSTNAPKAGEPDYNTFVSVLDPSPTLPAHATITYYTGACGAAGQTACPSQAVSLIPYERLVFKPTIGLGYHNKFTISVVSSDNPIIAERLLYVKDNISTAGGWTTGAIMGVGATAPGNDWLFAEGYTGSNFQEYFELANFGTSATTAHIKLEYTNGSTQTVSVSVPALGYAQPFDVNYAAAHPSNCVPAACAVTGSVSAEITSDSPIVAERLMYFHFGPDRISGVTDMVGTPAAHSTYAFAEGYTNRPFAEFITLQNPTGANETALVTFYTPTTAYQEQVTVVAHSRTTIDVDVDLAAKGASGAVSTLVQAQGAGAVLVAERPQYFIFNTGQGGTDVIGYTGN